MWKDFGDDNEIVKTPGSPKQKLTMSMKDLPDLNLNNILIEFPDHENP